MATRLGSTQETFDKSNFGIGSSVDSTRLARFLVQVGTVRGELTRMINTLSELNESTRV
jgi:hypothetical protein